MPLRSLQNLVLSLTCGLLLAACGGGNSSTTTISGAGLNSLGQSPAVSLFAAPNPPFAQRVDNLLIEVNAGPARNFAAGSANILYATVTVCDPANPANCATIPHVLVDTGSVGLRVLASTVAGLGLPAVPVFDNMGAPTGNAYECYPFVIGGIWGRTVSADITMGRQTARAVPIQVIEDGTQAPNDCVAAAGGKNTDPITHQVTYDTTVMLDSVDRLGANGVLGIGSTSLDCGVACEAGNYAGRFVQYYSCQMIGAATTPTCPATGTAMPQNTQVFNPVSALPAPYNNGISIALPAVPWPGAVSATGELVFGVNATPIGARQIKLGTDYLGKPNSYLYVTTSYKGQTIALSYLDTGTNGFFFTDPSLARCIIAKSTNPSIPDTLSPWFCPASTQNLSATISDGDNPALNQTAVNFSIGNADAVFATRNTAFGQLGGSPPASNASGFAWGLPFFFGKRVYLSIWADGIPAHGPWYAWELL